MPREINDGKLCVLVRKPGTGEVDVEYFEYDIPYQSDLNRFVDLCHNHSSTLFDLIELIERTPNFYNLDGEYEYCTNIAGTYQGFKVDNGKAREVITKEHDRMLALDANEQVEFDLEEAISDYKNELAERYTIYCKAFAINKAYKSCCDDERIMTFSHRLHGWSNPDYKLTPNFSVEVKTNFGYGWSSYFYTKLKFKGIEITPFSDWVQYEHAKVSEIVRYSQKYLLEHEQWSFAMHYCKTACNLSLTDETAFVDKYVLAECEEMANGLEELFITDKPRAKNKYNDYYVVDKKGRLLIEYRGEKISGALDLIAKILAFDKIASIRSFIKRIEVINKKMQPVLVAERDTVTEEIKTADNSLLLLKPKFLASCNKNQDYTSKKSQLREQMANELDVQPKEVNIAVLDANFLLQYPDYKAFETDFREISERYHHLVDHIKNLNKILTSISNYVKKIGDYFK